MFVERSRRGNLLTLWGRQNRFALTWPMADYWPFRGFLVEFKLSTHRQHQLTQIGQQPRTCWFVITILLATDSKDWHFWPARLKKQYNLHTTFNWCLKSFAVGRFFRIAVSVVSFFKLNMLRNNCFHPHTAKRFRHAFGALVSLKHPGQAFHARWLRSLSQEWLWQRDHYWSYHLWTVHLIPISCRSRPSHRWVNTEVNGSIVTIIMVPALLSATMIGNVWTELTHDLCCGHSHTKHRDHSTDPCRREVAFLLAIRLQQP